MNLSVHLVSEPYLDVIILNCIIYNMILAAAGYLKEGDQSQLRIISTLIN